MTTEMTETPGMAEARRRAYKRQGDVLSCLPQLSDFEQRAEIEARQERGELIELNGTWYERVDFNLGENARIWHVGDSMPDERPDVTDRRFITWSWGCDEEAYVSALGEVASWGKLLRLFGPVTAPLANGGAR